MLPKLGRVVDPAQSHTQHVDGVSDPSLVPHRIGLSTLKAHLIGSEHLHAQATYFPDRLYTTNGFTLGPGIVD